MNDDNDNSFFLFACIVHIVDFSYKYWFIELICFLMGYRTF